ncbi:MAG: IS481 family transposase, partial [Hydrogenophilales bacterium 12-61-10]
MVERILQHGLRPEEAAQSAGVSVHTAYKWLRRFHEEGEHGLVDRSSRPHHCPHALPEATQARIVAARIERQTYRQISQTLSVGHSSVGRVLLRQGLNRLASLEPAPPVQRYEHDAPGEMLHLDI